MTREELKQFIKDTTAPMLKTAISKDVADAVRENIESLFKDARGSHGLASKLFSGVDDTPKLMPGTAFARCARAVAAAKLSGGGPESAVDILRKWGNDDLATKWQEGRTKALAAGDATAGGFLVPTQFSADIIELLRPSAVVRSLNPTVMPMPMGNLKVPKVVSGATASYVGENANISKTQQSFGQITLSFRKLAAVVPISNDLVRYSTPQADAVVRDDVVRSIAQREDKAFIRDDGMSGTPKGIKNWINASNRLAATASVSLAGVTNDLGRLIQALLDNNVSLIPQQQMQGSAQPVDSRPGWIISPRTYKYLTTVQTSTGLYAFRDEMVQRGTLWGYPYRVTSQVLQTMSGGGASFGGSDTGSNQSEIYFGAFAHAVIGEALSMMVDASQEAAYYDGSAVQAAFSQDQTVIRVIEEHDFCLRQDVAFAILTGVTWGV